MSARSRQSHQLAQALTEHFDLLVELVYYGEPDRHGNGAWRVSWTDGPTPATMRGEAGPQAFDRRRVARMGAVAVQVDRLGEGGQPGQVLHLLAEHCRRGWEHAERWLDGLIAVEEDRAGDGVFDFSKARERRREQR